MGQVDGMVEYLPGVVTSFVTDDLGRDYPTLLDSIKTIGEVVESRGGNTRELIAHTLTLFNPLRCVVNRTHFSQRFMFTEIELLLAGRHHDGLLRSVLPAAADLITPMTAYGPRTWHQLVNVEKELADNPESRRAVVYIGEPNDLSRAQLAGEMPCTMTWQFLARQNHLHMIVNMRSWDAVWGLSYDVPSFVAIQAALAKSLGLWLGTYTHHSGSLHIYNRHVAEIMATPASNSCLDVRGYLGKNMAETRINCSKIVDGKVAKL